MNPLKPRTTGLRKKMAVINQAEYPNLYPDLNFITHEKAVIAETARANAVGRLMDALSWEFNQTKPYLHDLSPGCRICGSGQWSCLFINGKCNCRCFYCPAPQDDLSVPTTNRLAFSESDDYAEYVNHFSFAGVSLSGGEPLLTFNRTLDYIRTVRMRCSESLYIWMYTNGTLMTPDDVHKLADAGLNEIRFDIGATDYDLKKLKMAIGHIPAVTVEIPAVPEDMERFSRLVPMLEDAGINYLNLHQLRLTPHNSALLKKRNYTFLHGEKVTVLESELAVLNLFEQAVSNRWSLPINYCSFAYKNRFQQAAARKRSAALMCKGHESVTEKGFIRGIRIAGNSDDIIAFADKISRKDTPGNMFEVDSKKCRMSLHESLWHLVDLSKFEVSLAYAEAVLVPALSYRHAFKEIQLNSRMKIFAEKQTRTPAIILSCDEAAVFGRHVIEKDRTGACPDDQQWVDYEFIQEGLQSYY